MKVAIAFDQKIWKEDRTNREVTATKKLVPNNRKIVYQARTHARTHTQTHEPTQEELVPTRNPNEAILSDESNDENAQNGALRTEEHTKNRIRYTMNILQGSERKTASNKVP